MKCLLPLLAAPAALLAQKDPPLPPPPSPVPATASVERGQSVGIRLKAGGRTPGAVEFLIRSQPASGTLSPPRRISKTEAEVTYSHGGGSGGLDGFRYAVQTADSPVSAPAEVVIQVLDPPARLEPGPALDFGAVEPGGSRTLEAVWHNRGGVPARLRVAARPPFTVRDGQFVPPGGSVRVPVTFSPREPGEYQQELRAGGGSPAVLPVFGTCRRLIAVETDGPPVFRNGTLRLHVTNLSEAPASITVEFPPGSLLQPRTAAPGETLPFDLHWPEKNPEPELPIRIRAGDSTEILTASGGERRPALKGPAELDFGKTAPASASSLHFTLENAGAGAARLRAEPPPGLRVLPDPSSLVLPPHTSRQFEAVLEGLPPGRFAQTLRIFAGDEPPLEIPVRAEVEFPPAPPPEPSPSPSARRVPTRELLALAEPAAPETTFLPPSELPAPSPIAQLPSPPFYLKLSWPATSPPAARYVVEARAVIPGQGDAPPLIKWNTWPRARFDARDGKITATLPGAAPHSLWFLRVRALDAAGRSSEPSPIFEAAAPGNPLPWGVLLAALLTVPAAVAAWKILRRRRALRRSFELRRLARLENPEA